MGGLAAREFTTNPKYSNSYLNIEKIVTIGTPHAGSPFANMREELVGDVHKIIWEIPSRDRSECTLIMASTDDLFNY